MTETQPLATRREILLKICNVGMLYTVSSQVRCMRLRALLRGLNPMPGFKAGPSWTRLDRSMCLAICGRVNIATACESALSCREWRTRPLARASRFRPCLP